MHVHKERDDVIDRQSTFHTPRGQKWRLPCPDAGADQPVIDKGLLCVFDLGTLLSRRNTAMTTTTEEGQGVSVGDDDGNPSAGSHVTSSSSNTCEGMNRTEGRFLFAEEALELFRSQPPRSSNITFSDVNSFDPFQPPPASPAAMFAASSFLQRLWTRGGLAPAVRDELETATRAALLECLRDDDNDDEYKDDTSRKQSQTSLSSFPRAVSVHVRRGDACMRWAEPGDSSYEMGRPCYRTAHYVRAAEEMAEMYDADVALLATDDPDVLEEARRLSAERTAAVMMKTGEEPNGKEEGGGTTIPTTTTAAKRRPKKLRWCMVPEPAREAVGGEQWTNRYVFNEPVDWETYPDSESVTMIEHRLKRGELDPADVVLSLLKDVDLLRRGVAFVGTFKSVTGRLMYLSMYGKMRRPPPYVSLDMPMMEHVV